MCIYIYMIFIGDHDVKLGGTMNNDSKHMIRTIKTSINHRTCPVHPQLMLKPATF